MILITGATGIVGSHIAIELLKSGKDVRLLVRPTSNKLAIEQLLDWHNLEDRLEYVEGDINDPVSLSNAMDGVSVVYHCAATVHFGGGKKEELFQTNVIGTRNVVDQCLVNGVKLCYISSTAAIGSQLIDGKITENSSWESTSGRSDYSISKREAEMEVWRAIEEGLDAVVVNPCVIIGPGNWGQSSTSMIMTAIKGLMFYPSGGNAMVDARDVAEISIALRNSDPRPEGRHLLVGENKSFKGYFDMACSIAGSTRPKFGLPNWLVLSVARGIKIFESLGLWSFKVNSSSLESACRVTVFSNDKVRKLGYSFRPISESVAYSLEVYKRKA